MRRLSSSLAAAGLLTGVVLSTAPAYAAGEPVFTLDGPAEVGLRPYPDSGEPQSTTLDVTVNNPSEDQENGGFDGEYTVTFDLSGLTGVADVTFGQTGSSHCTLTGTTGTCTDPFGIPPGLNSVAQLKITAAKDSKTGATGDIEVTGTAHGATFTPFTSSVTVGGPDLVMHPLDLKREVKPGEVQPAPITFSNTGTSAADGVRLTLMSSHGLDHTRRYTNCEYTETKGWTKAVCGFPGTYEPGATYTLAEPIGLKAAGHAYTESFIHRIEERSGSRALAKGAGPRLTLKKAPTAARAADLDPWNNQQEFDLRADNTADFAAYGASLTAAAGTTVEATVGFRNNGPAWIGNIRSGEPVATVDVTIPQGATVTRKPAHCQSLTADGKHREEELGAPRYACDTPIRVYEDDDFALPFELRIDKVVSEGARGAVTVRNVFLNRPELGFDVKSANNTAQLVLNPKTSGTDTTGGTGGTAATGGSTTSGGTATTTGSTSTTGTTGATGATGGSTPTSHTGGGLADTGSSALPIAVGAAALLAAGAAFVTLARRRSRA
ncbi:peptidase [Streptomyces ficellus]|uniref:Peptidase n=1 Tax=Streptomyces ficellus TaxID=1977088 RepID=A0ABT7ZB99_9ACTN|nr:peptidase [Streptomyces ficellus]MDN3296725.1 peptidase [Streptomyces ficellus]